MKLQAKLTALFPGLLDLHDHRALLPGNRSFISSSLAFPEPNIAIMRPGRTQDCYNTIQKAFQGILTSITGFVLLSKTGRVFMQAEDGARSQEPGAGSQDLQWLKGRPSKDTQSRRLGPTAQSSYTTNSGSSASIHLVVVVMTNWRVRGDTYLQA